jgi:hypothetical protein
VDLYLSGIANQLESHFPDVHQACKSTFISHALQEAKHRYNVPTTCKLPLTHENLKTIFDTLPTNPAHDDLLFVTQVLVGTNCLMYLSELTWPDKLDLQVYRKVSMRHTMQFLPNTLSFWLTCHKADQFFKGNHINLQHQMPAAFSYLAAHDTHIPIHPELWLCANGTIPMQAWFIAHLHRFFTS